MPSASSSPRSRRLAESVRNQRLVGAAVDNVPEGTWSIGLGLMIAGLTAYGFQILARRQLTENEYTALNGLWFVIFIVTPGFFQPIEQEVSRAIAHRSAQGIGSGPLVRRAGLLGGILATASCLAALAAGPLLINQLFKGQGLLLAALVVGIVCYFGAHLTRGTLSGNRRFRAYGTMHGAEGIVRMAATIALVVIGAASPGLYGFALAVPPLLAIAVSLRGERELLTPGPDAPYSELSNALALMLAGSLLAQTLSYAAPLGAYLLHSKSEEALLAGFVSAVYVARIPILMIQALQAALLPKLAGLAGERRHDDFRSGIRKLILLVAGLGAIGTVAAATLGPTVGKILFGAEKWTLGNRDLGLLAAGSGVFIVALTVAQGLIALQGYVQVLVSWLAGLVTVIVVAALGHDTFLRMETGFLAGASVSTVLLVTLLARRMKHAAGDLGELVEIIEHEPLEI